MKIKINKIFAALLLGSTLTLTSCGSIIDHSGYVAQIGAVEDLSVGMGKTEVNSIMGSPSVTTSANGLSYYYISSKSSRYNILGPKENERTVVAVHFGRNKKVTKVAHYGLQDGILIDFISKTTPTYKKDLNILQELFGGIGASIPGNGPGSNFASGDAF